ncbi:putative WRKY transcription factor 4 [Senna tora]|uniref:Putative WRKY transcription factor 4 n=1 Tax=Senna tora TaxID=362788 RepID=A0A834W4H0_9FABA|nr:putative WRKY transcription factor 4 [Senna tora]
MGGIGDQPPYTAAPGPPRRPTIALPPRTSMMMDTLFNNGGPSGGAFGFSPGPMTLVSSLFNENDDFKSFSQLLAGAMASPVAAAEQKSSGEVGGGGPMFTIPPGLSPAGLLDSPGFFSASQGPFGMSHQRALAQFTAQAVQENSNVHIRDENPSVSAMPAGTFNTRQHQVQPHSMQDSGASMKECPDDGFNWRKYGQKQVKGSEFPRSYYKCTHPNCPVKKKVERSLDDDHVVAIIYKGQHNHQPPRPNKQRTKDAALTSNENLNMQGNLDLKEGIACESAAEQVSEGLSDSEEAADHEPEVEEKNDEPDPKRRQGNIETRVSDAASSHRTAMEPRIIVQTTSEVDLLDDGYRWRKYGQKVVKGNPYPRSYYKCTTAGCNVRKHVERASTDPKAVITTYEGKHNHDVPAAKTNSHTIANNTASQLKSHNAIIPEKHSFSSRGIGTNEQQPVARLRLKEEQIT